MSFPCAMHTNLSDRAQKVKEAHSEAAKEVENYKAQKAAEFVKFEAEVLSLT